MHSPFVFDFIKNVLNKKVNKTAFAAIENLRRQYKNDEDVLIIEDLGAGSVISKTNKRKVATIASVAVKPQKYSQLFYKMIQHYQCKHIIELGTSLGITTAYLAQADLNATVVSLEGAKAVASKAQQGFDALRLSNIELILGNFDDTFQTVLDKLGKVDFIYIDGNHQLDATLRYFNQLKPYLHDKSIVVLDDIHWSKGMEDAWNEIRKLDFVKYDIDLFQIGILLFNTDFKEKQSFVIKY